MIIDIFSSFDPAGFFVFLTTITWITPFIILIIVTSNIWVTPTPYSLLTNSFVGIIENQSSSTYISKINSSNNILTALFISIILVNFWGITPYNFSISSHLAFTLIIAIPLWFRIIISSFWNCARRFAGLLLPSGAPNWLNPFLVLIETVRTSVRPVTLGFRLAANIRAGHVVLTLLRIYASSTLLSSLIPSILLVRTEIFYTLFEAGICVVQAFIFCLLVTLYADDHRLINEMALIEFFRRTPGLNKLEFLVAKY